VPAGAEPSIESLTQDLIEGRRRRLREMFSAQGASTPIVIWDPSDPDLRHPVVRAFAARMRGLRDADGRMSVAAFEEADLAGFEDWMMVLETVLNASGAAVDFRYLHYGSDIAANYGRDMTGQLTSDIGGYISVFFTALYQAVMARGDWVKSMHEPPSEVFARTWRRLIVPLHDGEGHVVRIAVLNVADNDLRAGLEAVPDPVMVVAQSGNVTFANRAARSLFGERRFLADPVSLAEYSGIVLDLSQPRESLLDRRVVTEETQIGVNNSLIVHFRVTRSVIYYRDLLYYLVIAKPE
jgi:PAS domain-containing protein